MSSLIRNCVTDSPYLPAGITELPAPQFDETIYSLCARIAHNALTFDRSLSNCLLGYRYGPRHPDLLYGLSQLESLYRGAKNSLVVDELTIRTRTVLGGVMPFLCPADRAQLVQTLRQPGASASTKRMLSLRGTLDGICTALRRCPDCAASDLARLGFTYWHTVHQLPGVWVCPLHGRPLQWLAKVSPKERVWLVAHRSDGDFQELLTSAKELDLLHRLAAAVVWSASQWSLGAATMPIMVRARLQYVGLLATEGIATDAEQRRIHRCTAEVLARTFPQLFSVFRSPEWVGKTLTFSEFSHPLRWAVLIATTLTEREHLQPPPPAPEHEQLTELQVLCRVFLSKATDELDTDYALAQQRAPQLELFPDRRGMRRRLAPDRLYEALGKGLRITNAVQCSGLTAPQIRNWVRKDKALANHWHDSIARLRTEQACHRIEQHLLKDPCALRSQVLLAQVASVRALERYAPERLDSLLPQVQSKYSKQQRLTF